jgi:ABC-type polysaccharide/polyol phosphate export permease
LLLFSAISRALAASRFLIRNLVATELKLRYHRSVLGVVLDALNPRCS